MTDPKPPRMPPRWFDPVRTTVLITPEEVDAAAKLSTDYRAPGA